MFVRSRKKRLRDSTGDSDVAKGHSVKKSLARYWVWKILRLTLLLLLILVLVDILMSGSVTGLMMFNSSRSIRDTLKEPISSHLIPPRVHYDPYDRLKENPEASQKAIHNKILTLDVRPDGLIARHEVYLPKDHPLFVIVQSRDGAKNKDDLVKDVLGPVRVQGTAIEFYEPETVVPDNDANGHIYMLSHSFTPTDKDYSVEIELPGKGLNLQIEKQEVLIKTSNAQVWSESETIPILKTNERTVNNPVGNAPFYFHVHVPDWVTIPSQPNPTLASFMSKSINLPVLGLIIFGLLGAFPLLLFLV